MLERCSTTCSALFEHYLASISRRSGEGRDRVTA